MKKNSAIYRAAARRIANGRERFSCCAVDSEVLTATGGASMDPMYARAYSNLFSPNEARELRPFDFGERHPNGTITKIVPPEAVALRTLALCFMAAIAAYEEKHGVQA